MLSKSLSSSHPIVWFDVLELGVHGRGWPDDAGHPYNRLPAHAEGIVTEAVWELGKQSAGMWVDFISDASNP